MTPPWTVGTVQDRAELERILALQRANLSANVSAEEASAQGFVTAVHDLDALERMHALAPSIVARSLEEHSPHPNASVLAGYALTMLVEARRYVPILEPMFQLFETLSWRERPLAAVRFYVMGQVCVAKPFRGQGVFDALY